MLTSILYSVWKTSADAALVAAKNFSFIHQPSDYFYLASVAMSSLET